jgi:Leucine-rich repeat (LRR) protein
MFASNSFQFETPNVIDPGDLPPSQPPRSDKIVRSHDPGEEKQQLSGVMGSETYYNERESAKRLLRSISDLDINGDSAAAAAYDPYDDDDEEGTAPNSHSLPSVDEARMYAASLLSENKRRNSRSFQRTVQLSAAPKSKHLVRQHALFVAAKVCSVVIAIVLITVVVVVATTRNKSNAKNYTGSSSNNSNYTYPTDKVPNAADRRQQVLAFLLANGISSQDELSKNDSPQAIAANWIAQYDVLQRPVPTNTTLQQQSRFVQRYALATVFFALNGPSWTDDLKFLSAQDECAWFKTKTVQEYVTRNVAIGVTCDVDLNVKSLYIPENELQGTLPDELQYLTRLDMVGMPYNRLRGTFPSEYRSLTNLFYLDVKYNRLSGPLPDFAQDMRMLEVLGLSNNDFAGPVPAGFGSLGRLKTLALDDNALTGSLTWANNLSELEFFYAERNAFTGQIDDSFFTSLTKLRELDLSSTSVDGPNGLPMHFLQHPALEVLDLSYTQMNGTIPEFSLANTVLQFLSLRNTGISGPIPYSISNLQKLWHLDLTGNALSSEIPNTMGVMKSLYYLFLGQNNFAPSVEFPPMLSQLRNLHELDMSGTSLQGSIPSWVRFLSQLTFLDLSNNALKGTIPTEVWNVTNLEFLLVHDNQLTGTIPTQGVTNVANFQIVSIYKNNFTNGNINYFCEKSGNLAFMAADCNMTCSSDCCRSCCDKYAADAYSKSGSSCFQGELPKFLDGFEGMWEFRYQRAPYAYDTAILNSSNVGNNFTTEVVSYPNPQGGSYLPIAPGTP